MIFGTAADIGMPKRKIYEWINSGSLLSNSSDLSSTLIYDNCRHWGEFFLDQIDIFNEIFANMFNEIYIDKKWFYMTQARRKYYLGNEEG